MPGKKHTAAQAAARKPPKTRSSRKTQATSPTPVTDPTAEARPTAGPRGSAGSALAAAARVLAETGQALSCRQLIAAMAAQGYWTSPAGRTPHATLFAALSREIRRKKDQARFRKAAPGRFTLA